MFILDNETSTVLLSTFKKEGIQYQLVLPHNHCRNAAERAIATWKEHFIAGLCSVHPEFPILEWDCIIFQGMLTLNLHHNSRVTPKLLAWEYIFGRFDFIATPIAPLVVKLIVHNKRSQQASWDPHGVVGFYVGPALHHYRCLRCYIPTTQSE